MKERPRCGKHQVSELTTTRSLDLAHLLRITIPLTRRVGCQPLVVLLARLDYCILGREEVSLALVATLVQIVPYLVHAESTAFQ